MSEAANHGLQVFNLVQLLNVNTASMPMRFAETACYNKFDNAHNICINEDTGFAYVVGSNTYSAGLHIMDIKIPPTQSLPMDSQRMTTLMIVNALFTLALMCVTLVQKFASITM